MLTFRRAAERGHANRGWLEAHFSFSFADFQDPSRMGYRALRIFNEDLVVPGKGFSEHGHQDLEIISYVLEGALRHQDTTGITETLVPGELLHMSAGTGLQHSEMNPSATEPVHFIQVWLTANKLGIPPLYEQKKFPIAERLNEMHLLASKDGRAGSFVLHADAELSVARLNASGSVTHEFRGDYGWLQVARGGLTVQGDGLKAGDALEIKGEEGLTISSATGGEFLLFDLD